jgi:flavin-dependent dehydrogenase
LLRRYPYQVRRARVIYDALVIGGGPAGATTALLLARAGWSVAVVEKATFPRRKVCGEFISATTLPLLHELGVAGSFLERAGPAVRRVGFFAGDAILSAPMPETRSERDRWGRALGREHLDVILLQGAITAGAEIWQPWSATALRQSGDVHVCTIVRGGESVDCTARVVVLANGSWEKGPLPLPAATRRPSDLLGFKAHFSDSALPEGLMPLLAFTGGYGGMVHTDSGRVSLSCCVRRDRLKATRERMPGLPAGEAVIRHIKESCRGVREALAPARMEGAWLSAGPMRIGIRQSPIAGVYYAGNLAGEAHPIIAEGISMAMQSAWLLSRHLIAAGPHAAGNSLAAEVGASYASDWRRQFALRLRSSIVFAGLLMRPGAGPMISPIVRGFPGLLTFGAQMAGKARELPAV